MNSIRCPKCDWNVAALPCPLSGWHKCPNPECGVVFNKYLQVIKSKEQIIRSREDAF